MPRPAIVASKVIHRGSSMQAAGAEGSNYRGRMTPVSVDYDVMTGKSVTRRHPQQQRRRDGHNGFTACNWFRNGGFKYLFVAAWTGLNVFTFWWSYMQYKMEGKYYYLRGILGVGLCFSRGSAAVLNLNCATILLPMCRCLISLIRRSKHVHRSTRRCLNRSRFMHIVIAIFICLGTIIHCVAHFFNAVNFSQNYNINIPDVNVARYLGESPCRIIFTTVPGLTGCLMLLILTLIVVTSCRAVRASRHELFWYCHQFFVVFYVLLICHSLGGVLKEQQNINMHTPGCIDTPIPAAEPRAEPEPNGDWRNSTGMICEEKPAFVSHRSDTWCFLLVPAILYISERLWRFFKTARHVTIISVRFHAGDVIELRLHVDRFGARPGQYVTLCCPVISRLEWHPFTITRCPSHSNSTFTLHIRVKGDWTSSFRNLFIPSCDPGRGDVECLKLPKLHINGPFGSASEDVFRYDTSLCIAGGVGVTPFAAVLNDILDSGHHKTKLRRLYFIWVCRHVETIEWFAESVAQLHRKLWDTNRPDLLTFRLYVTGGGVNNLMSTSSILGLVSSRVERGRPNFKQIFSEVARCNPRSSVGVFVCGPKKLSQRVHKQCNGRNRFDTKFHYNKESFG